MKKLTVFLIVMFACGVLFAQNVTETFTYTDSWTFVTPLYLPDGTTPIPGGYLIEVCLPVVPGVMDYDNDWHGPELTNNGSIQQIEPGFDGFFLFSPPFTWFQPGGGTEPCANTGESIYLRIYDAVDVASATNYMNSDWLLGLPGGPFDTEVSVWNAWEAISAGQEIPSGGGTVTFPAGGGSITFLPGNSGTIDMTFDPANPPPGIPGVPQNLWWDYDTSGATITFWPVRLRLEFPFAAGVTYASSAILHYTDASWWSLVHPSIPVHPNNVGQIYNFSWDYTTDPSFVEFDTWTLSDWGMDSENPLPVTLTNFAAEFVADNLTILWTTQSENSNMGWNIYRGESNTALEEDNTILINVEMIEGAGTTSEPTNYAFIDEYPVVENDTYWYWLESVSYSSDTGIYGPISLTIPEGETPPPLPTITLLKGNYPNPFNPTTFIQFDIKEGETGQLIIFNIRGQIIESETFEAGAYNYEWNSGDNASGVYFYKLRSESYSAFKKMMILK